MTVAYLSLHGAETGPDPEFGIDVKWDVPLLEGHKWVVLRNRSLWPGLGRFFGLINPSIYRFVVKGSYDIVVCFGYRTASFWIAAIAARRSGAKLVVSTDAHSFKTRKGTQWKERLKHSVVPVILKAVDAVIAPSTRTVRYLRQEVGIRSVFLVPYVVDNGFFEDRATSVDRERVRERWGIDKVAPAAAFVGKLASWKGISTAVEAAALVPRLHLVVAGAGPEKEAIVELTVRRGIADRVHFLGFKNQSELPDVYVGADFLVVPSIFEPFGLVVNEAFACGRPALVSDACGAAGDLVVDGQTGYVFPAGDHEALAALMSLLVEDGDLTSSLGVNAKRKVHEWGPRQNAQAFTEMCLSLTRKGDLLRNG